MGFFIVLGLFLWFMVALWPAYFAKQKGYSFLLFLLISWVVSWVLTLIVVFFLEDKNKQQPTAQATTE